MTQTQTASTPRSSRRDTKLYRDPSDKKIAGVASGVAKYFDIDTTLTRVVWGVASLMGGFGIVLYIVLWIVLDDDPEAYLESDAVPAVEAESVTDAEALAEEEIESDTFRAEDDSSEPETD